MHETSVWWDGRSTWLRVVNGRADGIPQPELAAVLLLGEERECVKVASGARVQGADVLYRLTGDLAGGIFEKLAERAWSTST
jgi:hypothetical protein